jgi:hypothetical protein
VSRVWKVTIYVGMERFTPEPANRVMPRAAPAHPLRQLFRFFTSDSKMRSAQGCGWSHDPGHDSSSSMVHQNRAILDLKKIE